MPVLRRIGLPEILEALSEIQTLHEFSHTSSRKRYDLYIGMLGFEERCVAIPEFMANNKWDLGQAVIFSYATNYEGNEANNPIMSQHLSKCTSDIVFINIDDDLGMDKLRTLCADLIGRSAGTVSVLLDVSVAANRAILSVGSTLFQFPEIDLTILYCEAQHYLPTRSEVPVDQPGSIKGSPQLFGLETGVSGVRVSPHHQGQQLDSVPDCVVLIPSFNPERSAAVVNFVDPTLTQVPKSTERLQWLVGLPPDVENRWRAERMVALHQVTELSTVRYSSTLHYKETITSLTTLYDTLSNKYNITVSPLGSKMQALGTTIFCILHPDVRVVFAIPDTYHSAHYSKGIGPQWVIPFGHLKLTHESLKMFGQLVIED